jgi:hypothetical protein
MLSAPGVTVRVGFVTGAGWAFIVKVTGSAGAAPHELAVALMEPV